MLRVKDERIKQSFGMLTDRARAITGRGLTTISRDNLTRLDGYQDRRSPLPDTTIAVVVCFPHDLRAESTRGHADHRSISSGPMRPETSSSRQSAPWILAGYWRCSFSSSPRA